MTRDELDLPHDWAAEAQVIGAMLHSRNAIAVALGTLQADDLLRGTHKKIWAAIVDLHTRGDHVDPVTVVDELDRRGDLEQVPPAIVADLSAGCLHPASIGHHARIVATHAQRRRQVELGHQLAARGTDPTHDPNDTTTWAITQLETATSRRRTIPLLVGDEVDNIDEPAWLVDGLLPEGLSVIYGRRSSGKSFLAMAWAASIATGVQWHGRTVRSSPVVYCVAEGASGARARRRAWMAATHTPRVDHLAWIPTAVDPADPADASVLAQHTEQVGAGLVVLDTVARCMTGDENSTEDMGRFIAGCDRLRDRTGASILLVHHSDKADQGLRGNSSLGDSCDGIIHMRLNKDRSRTMRPEKAKEAEPAAPVDFELQPFAGSVVLVEISQHKPSPVGAL